MAYRKKPKAEKSEKPSRTDEQKLLIRIRDRFKVMTEADQDNRTKALEDLRFVNEPGAQWDKNMKKERGNRPCYEFNKLRINGKRVINEIRANRPQGKVRAVEGGDKKTAELYEGLCRNIANISDLDTIVDNAAEYQIDAGMGAWRVETEYSDDTVFDQDIVIKPIKNPFCLYADPSCQDVMKRDAEDWILTEKISKKAFEARYPKAEPVSFTDDVQFDDDEEWETDEHVRVAEYWYKEPYDKEIWLVAFPQENGTTKTITVDSMSDEGQALAQQPNFEAMVKDRRTAKCHRIMQCIVGGGDKLLAKPSVQAGSQHRFIMVYGEVKVIDGRLHWWGLHRFSKDAQRSYNISRTSIDETIALAPQAKFWATPDQAKGHTTQWAIAHKENMPFQLYNPDAKAPGPPADKMGAQVPVALIQQAQISAQDIRDTTGLHEASFGEESGEKSGIALARKQNQAQVVTYNFPDNMAKGIRRTWEILIDLIPEIYDSERELRIIGADGAEDYAKVNEQVMDPASGKMIRVNDLSTGKYDVAITVGPSFSTMRQEAAEVYGEMAKYDEMLMPTAADLVYKALDYPYSEEIAKRRAAMLPPPIQKMLSEGKEIPPEAQAAMAQAEQAMQMVQQQTELVQQAAQEVQQEQQQSEKAKSEVEKAIAKLQTEEARFEAKIAKVMADLQARESKLDMESAQLDGQKQQLEGQRSQIEAQQQQTDAGTEGLSQAAEAVAQIDAAAAQFMEMAHGIMQQMQALLAEIKAKPRMKSVRMERVNGQPPRAIAEYDDTAVQ
jgi:hypothetical protein